MFPVSIPSSFQEASLPCTAAAPHFLSEHPDLSKQEVAAVGDVYTFWELWGLVGTPPPTLPKNSVLGRERVSWLLTRLGSGTGSGRIK